MAGPKAKTRRRDSLDGYLELVRRFPLRRIRSDKELDHAIAVIDALLDRDRLTPAEEDYLDLLGDLVERFEDNSHAIKGVSDAAMLCFMMDQKEVTPAEVSRAARIAESRISEVLSGRRRLTRIQIEKLSRYFHVTPAVFLHGAGNGSER